MFALEAWDPELDPEPCNNGSHKAAEMAPKSTFAFPEDPSLVPNIQHTILELFVTPVSKDPSHSAGLWGPQRMSAHTHTHK